MVFFRPFSKLCSPISFIDNKIQVVEKMENNLLGRFAFSLFFLVDSVLIYVVLL